MIDAALLYAKRGWTVFPAPVGTKKSHIAAAQSGGPRWGATSDYDTLRRYWTQFPKANVAVVTGQVSGIFVIDVDTDAGHGVDGFASLAALPGHMPETLTAQSPSGSKHFYFNWPDTGTIRNSVGKIGPGLDVRGDGGMVIAPPSVKPDGGVYIWNNSAPIADAPAWLLEMVCSTDTPQTDAPRRATPPALGEVEELLTYIDPDAGGYQDWQTILSAIHDVSGGSDDGMDLADKWSERGANYKPGEVQDKWPSFTSGKGGGSGMGTIGYQAKQAGADVAAIGARHRLLNMPGPSHVPSGMMPTAPVQGMPSAPRAASVVNMICAKIQENPTVAVELLSDEVAQLSPADRDKVLAECKPHGIKTEMQVAVKRAINAYTIAKSAVTAAGVSAGPLSFYFIIENEFGQPVVMDRRGGMQPQSRVAFRDAKAALPAVMIIDPSSGNVRAKSAADHWWEDHETPRYDATGYDPVVGLEYTDNKGRKIRNVYQPGHDTPAAPVGPEAIEPFLYVLRSNFPNTEDQQILLQYMAHVVQFPGIQTRWAPVMQGTQGCGKGTISQAVTYCHGRANVAHPSTDVIATDFNGYMHRKTFIVVNEIGDHSKRELSAMSEKIKPWITDDPVHIHDKGKGSRDTRNFTNWIFTTNHLHCMLATPGERRYAHFISALQTEADASQAFYPSWWTEGDDWWGSYYDWWGAGGAEAVRGYLTHMAVAQTPSRAPVTSSTADAMKAGDGAALSLIREAITEGGSGFRGGWVSLNAVRDLLDAEDVKMPAGQFLARQLEQIGYRHSTRCHTSPSEANRFPKAPNRSRIYHIENKPDTDPQGVMALYDAAQRLGDDGPIRSTVVKMPGI